MVWGRGLRALSGCGRSGRGGLGDGSGFVSHYKWRWGAKLQEESGKATGTQAWHTNTWDPLSFLNLSAPISKQVWVQPLFMCGPCSSSSMQPKAYTSPARGLRARVHISSGPVWLRVRLCAILWGERGGGKRVRLGEGPHASSSPATLTPTLSSSIHPTPQETTPTVRRHKHASRPGAGRLGQAAVRLQLGHAVKVSNVEDGAGGGALVQHVTQLQVHMRNLHHAATTEEGEVGGVNGADEGRGKFLAADKTGVGVGQGGGEREDAASGGRRAVLVLCSGHQVLPALIFQVMPPSQPGMRTLTPSACNASMRSARRRQVETMVTSSGLVLPLWAKSVVLGVRMRHRTASVCESAWAPGSLEGRGGWECHAARQR